MTWHWLSFADPDLPENAQFLGALLIEAPDFETATVLATMKGLNPGGEIVGVEVPDDLTFPEKWRGRLLTRAEVEQMDQETADDD